MHAVPFDPKAEPALLERLVEAARLAAVGRLVASVVHQMSTPLAAISLRAESLEQSLQSGAAPGDRALRYSRAIFEEAGRCRQIMTAMREFGGPLDRREELVDVPALCRSAALLAKDEAARRQIQIELKADSPVGPVRGVKTRLGQAVLALLLNALDASPAGEQVTLEVTAAGDSVLVTVADRGHGLSDAARALLFEPFASTRPPEGGLGLGLLACRAVAEAHGGSVEAAGEAQGSRFLLRLPLAARRGAEVPDARS
ncbi:MAG: HAMP domain-containing sensor histidine kinase [Vicinamibacteria bacterium]